MLIEDTSGMDMIMESMTNMTMDNGSSPDDSHHPCLTGLAYVTTYSVCMTLTFISSIFGNTLILVAMCKYSRRFDGSLYMKIRNLAISDLVLGFAVILYPTEFLLPELATYVTFCVIRFALVLISLSVSGITTVFISIDRFMAVVFPMKHLVKTKRKTFFHIIFSVIWISSIAITVVSMVTKPQQSQGSFICRNSYLMDTSFAVVGSAFILTLFIINTSMYTVVIVFLSRNKLTDFSKGPNRVKTVAVIVSFAIHAILWLPFIVTSIITYAQENKTGEMVCLLEYTAAFGALDGGLNWIIYALSYEKFRTTFKELLSRKSENNDSVRNSS